MNRTFLPPTDECPLCPTGTGAYPPRSPPTTTTSWSSRTASRPRTGRPPTTPTWLDGDPIWPARRRSGRCEVICFTSDHDTSFAHLSPARARTVVEAWADRTAELARCPRSSRSSASRTAARRSASRCTTRTARSTRIPYVTPRTAAMLAQATRAPRPHRAAAAARRARRRAARPGAGSSLTSEHWTAYVPFAARWPVEVHLAPHRDVPDLPALTDAERDDLAAVYLELLRRLDRFSSPRTAPDPPAVHRRAGTRRRSARAATCRGCTCRCSRCCARPASSSTSPAPSPGMGGWINDTTPERIAARLREVAP